MDRILPSTTSLRTAVLPGLTVLLGTGGLAGGLYSFQSPIAWARTYGIICAPADSKNPSSEQTAFIQAIGARNMASGASLIALTAYWQFSAWCRASPVAALTVQRCLGFSLLVGSAVTLADAVVLSRLVKNGGLEPEAEHLTSGTSTGHAVMSLPILGLALWYLLA